MKAIKLILATAMLVVGLFPVSAQAFNLNCAYTRSLNDDPIVFQNLPGASHLHDFFGNRSTDAFSTTQNLGVTTSCQNSKDPSAYWAPAAYLGTTRILPKNIKAYYNRTIPGPLVVFPTGLRMLAGVSTSTAAQSTSVVYFGCGSGTGISKKNYPPDCTPVGGSLAIHVSFADCGSGALDSADHRSHVAYSVKGVCPAGYPLHFPQLQMRLNYDVKDARTLNFSSGAYWTEHADFLNAWDPTELQRLINTL